MYCKDCESYNEKSLNNCRKKGQTSPLRKADDLNCFSPKTESADPADPDAGIARMQMCTRCGRVLPADMFDDRKKKGGVGTIRLKVCRDCMLESASAGGKKTHEKRSPDGKPVKRAKSESKRPIKATVSARSADVKPKGEVFTVEDTLRRATDDALAAELRRRDWKGNLSKLLEI